KISARDLFGVGRGFLADTAASDEHLSLQNEFVFARFTLHVIDGIALFYVGVETENHACSIRNFRNPCISVKTLSRSGRRRLTLLPMNSNLERLSESSREIIYSSPYAGQLFRQLPAPPAAHACGRNRGERDCHAFLASGQAPADSGKNVAL